jgi:Derlin-2/3
MIEGRPIPTDDSIQDEVPTADLDVDAPGENDPVEAALVH